MRLYHLIRPYARVALGVFYRKIYLTGAENVPRDKPVILAANHPTAFTEPCIVACWLPQDLHFLVRGDFFRHPAANWALRQLNQVPVFRFKDAGYAGVKNNRETFKAMYETLAANKTVMILAEGNSGWEKRLRPLQKGSARMLLEILETYPDIDVHLIPVGVNYVDAPRFRSDVMIDFGTSIRTTEYADTYRDVPAKAIRQVTQRLDAAMRDLMVIIEDPADEPLTEMLLQMWTNERLVRPFPVTVRSRDRLNEQRQLANFVNDMAAPEKDTLRGRTSAYAAALNRHRLTDWGLLHPHFRNLWTTMVLALGCLPYVFGTLLNGPPAYLAYWIGREKFKSIEFKASIWASAGMGTFLIYYLLWFIVALIVGRAWFWLLFAFVPLLGYFAILYHEYLKKYRQAFRAAVVSPSTRTALLEQRAEIRQRVLA